MMRLVVIIGLLLVGHAVHAAFPRGVVFSGCGEVIEQVNPGRLPFYAIQDQNNEGAFGRIVFTPDGTKQWEYNWTFNGVPQPVVYRGDSTTLQVDLLGTGVYSFSARKDTAFVQSGDFQVFYVYVPAFDLELLNVDDCESINVKIKDFERAAFVENGVPFYGSKDLKSGINDKILVDIPNYDALFFERSAEVTYKDEMFMITVQDQFGFKWTSEEAEYRSVIPKAEFKVSPEEGEAPLEADFSNSSINAQRYEWFLFRDTSDMNHAINLIDSLIENRVRTEEDFAYTYEHPGLYKVFMVATNTVGANHCTDTAAQIEVRVKESLVDVPNVFTPNGDGINDVFRAKTQSLEWFQGIIINRWGRTLFEWTDPKDGWDGRIGGQYASPGTYYYIIKARGRELITKDYLKKGALLLVR